MKTVAFSGHRNKVLNWSDIQIDYFKNKILVPKIKTYLKEDYNHFVVGGATGFDMWVLEILIMAKQAYPRINIEVAIPFPNHTQFWKIQEVVEFNKLSKEINNITAQMVAEDPETYYGLKEVGAGDDKVTYKTLKTPISKVKKILHFNTF